MLSYSINSPEFPEYNDTIITKNFGSVGCSEFRLIAQSLSNRLSKDDLALLNDIKILSWNRSGVNELKRGGILMQLRVGSVRHVSVL